ncbi:histidine-containing phosphotransfer protein 1-like isoform X6 [Mangifera indica]|uniref:histidine-containing phosphotransfer protein 1-like isoform X6 n=1 Tax=Mangifera indica TaxID=29780 RepID=UPI001CFB2176|nr:histidine-containing phosphotransfer protein 1-like isoform X6 [Mangifera indica]
MALSIVKELLQHYVDSLVDEGVLNEQFSHIQTLRTEEPDFIEGLINTYCMSVEAILSELTSCINVSHVDYSRLAVLARQVENRSQGIGAEHVRLACADLIRACDQKHTKNFSQALNWINYEFAVTRNKLQAIAQMQRRIVRLVNKQQQQ